MSRSPTKAAGKAASSPRYMQNRCRRFKQSRFGPVQITALDGKKWWCLFDFKKNEYVPWYKFRTRRQAIVQLLIELTHNRLPYEPDPGFDQDWLKSRSAAEIRDLIDHKQGGAMTKMTVRDVLNRMDHEVWVRVRTDGNEGTGDKDVVVWSADWIGDYGYPEDLPKYLDWEADYLSIEIHKDPERGLDVPMLVVPAWSRGLEEKYRLRHRGCLPGEEPMPDDPMVGKEVVWSLREILEEINRDHSGEWTDYDETDWKEGLREWTRYELIGKE